MRETALAMTEAEKDLGVIISNKLKPGSQVDKIEAKDNQMVGRLKKAFTLLHGWRNA